jgi:hypothetical protein
MDSENCFQHDNGDASCAYTGQHSEQDGQPSSKLRQAD